MGPCELEVDDTRAFPKEASDEGEIDVIFRANAKRPQSRPRFVRIDQVLELSRWDDLFPGICEDCQSGQMRFDQVDEGVNGFRLCARGFAWPERR